MEVPSIWKLNNCGLYLAHIDIELQLFKVLLPAFHHTCGICQHTSNLVMVVQLSDRTSWSSLKASYHSSFFTGTQSSSLHLFSLFSTPKDLTNNLCCLSTLFLATTLQNNWSLWDQNFCSRYYEFVCMSLRFKGHPIQLSFLDNCLPTLTFIVFWKSLPPSIIL